MDEWSVNSTGFLVVTVLLGFVSIIGILGNGLVIAIITIVRRSGYKSSVQLFLVHLAISDLFVCILCIPMTIFSNFHYPISDRIGNVVLCKVVRFVQFVSPTLSIAVLTIISIDRFLSLTRPFLSKAPRVFFLRPYWLIGIAWFYSNAQFLPTFYFSTLLPVNISNVTVYYCTPIPNQNLPGRMYLFVIFLASFVVPVTTMIVLYYKVAKAVWNRTKQLSNTALMTQNDNNLKIMGNSRKTVTRMLLMVVAVFFLCWTPFVVYSGFLESRLKSFPNPMDAIRLGLYGLGLFNSICNPFIYYFNGANLNPRVLIENERKRRSSSLSSTPYVTRMTRLSSGNVSTQGRKRTLSNSPCSLMLPLEEVNVFLFGADSGVRRGSSIKNV